MKTRTKTKSKAKRRRKVSITASAAGAALGRRGGYARRLAVSPDRATEIGRKAAAARWGKPWPPVVDEPAPAVEIAK